MTIKPSSIEVILFDVGGVLVRWRDEWLFRGVASRYDLPLPQVKAILVPLREELQSDRISLRRMWELFSEEALVSFPSDYRTLWSRGLEEKARVNSSVMSVADCVRSPRWRTGIFSNTDRSHASIFRRKGWFDGFDPWMLSYELGATKPHSEAFRSVEETLRIDGRHILLIDDRQDNVGAAEDAGWQAVRYTSAPALSSELRKAGLQPGCPHPRIGRKCRST